ncbi:MAG: Cof-type HAD-IIB family hydrolase [Janthinobacterium lividum]
MTADAQPPIRAVVSDIDGTLLDPDKRLTPAAIAAVGRLHAAGVAFCLASSRPPAALATLIEQLSITAPCAAFNGGNIVSADLQVLSAERLSAADARSVLDELAARGLDAWLFSRGEWQITRTDGDYIDLETRTLGFGPRILPRFEDLSSVDKIVSATRDTAALARAEGELATRFGGALTVMRSQTYYLDFSHRLANKGHAIHALAQTLGVPLNEVAALGDMPNDLPMLSAAGMSIAMGQAEAAVRAGVQFVTRSNREEGFAYALEHFILPRRA